MWEAIRQNQRRSFLLILLMAIILIALGGSIGMWVDMRDGWVVGALVAIALWLLLWLIATAGGDSILLSSAGAREISKDDAPVLWNVVEEMTIAAGLGKMPKVYLIDDDSPNAFAVGRNPENASVAVTSGLLRRLNRDELQGVVAHEIGHIRNLDVRFMTLAAVMVGAIALISDAFLRIRWHGGGGRRSSSRGGGQAQLIIFLIVILLAILGPICAQLLYFACSRRRELLADASSARFTRFPEGLASALLKISTAVASQTKPNRTLAPLYIVNPLQGSASFGLYATHPPVEQRVAILRSMGGRVGYADYEAAYRQVTGQRRACIDTKTLETDQSIEARAPSAAPDDKEQAVHRARQAADIVDRLAGYLLIPCSCGLRIKIPPAYSADSVSCPRCGRTHDVPIAMVASVATALGVPKPAPPTAKAEQILRYRRKGQGWESFRCPCGTTVQLSPSFNAPGTRCPKCRRHIAVEASAQQMDREQR